MTHRARNIVVAVALAVVAALLTGFYVTSYKSSVQHSEEKVGVLVATHDIPAGTSGKDAIAKHYVSEQQVLQRTVVPGAVAHASDIADLVATQQVLKGEQVSTRRFNPPNQVGIRGELKGTLRAMQVSGNPYQVLAGILREGDHVDVVATIKTPAKVSRIVLRDLKVLRAAPAPSGASGHLDATSDNFPVVLAVSDTQVQKLLYAEQNAENWKLDLRPVVDAADSGESLEYWATMLKDGVSRAQINELRNAFNAFAFGGNGGADQ